MRVIKCDRCGKICEYYAGHRTITETNKAGEFTHIDIYSDNKTYDLCPECMREFKKFLENK